MRFSLEQKQNATDLATWLIDDNYKTDKVLNELSWLRPIVDDSGEFHLPAIVETVLKELYPVTSFLESLAYWQIIVILILFFILFILDRKYKIGKPIRFFFFICKTILIRVAACFGYYMPVCNIMLLFMPMLIQYDPAYFSHFVPRPVEVMLEVFADHPQLQTYYYPAVVITCQFLKFTPRFIRFHWMRGLMLDSLFFAASRLKAKTITAVSVGMISHSYFMNVILLVFFAYMYVLIPAILEALLGRYPYNSMVREATEVMLGRDGPDFKWWDRR